MKYAFLAVILAASSARAQGDPHGDLAKHIKDPELREATQMILRKMNPDYVTPAKAKMREEGELFNHARVEITGVASSDNTYKFNSNDFDGLIKPSYTNRYDKRFEQVLEKLDPITRALAGIPEVGTTLAMGGFDSFEFEKAAAGILTLEGQKAVKPYEGLEINEIVAHSWGTQLIYAAIINGAMLPPKKLILVGVPDNHYDKWQELAAHTGTEVIWMRSDNDKIAKLGAAIADRGPKVNYKKEWDRFCGANAWKDRCEAHGRTPKTMTLIPIPDNPGTAGHDRAAYYKILKEMKIIDGSVMTLRAQESRVLAAEIRGMQQIALEAALAEAPKLVAKMRARAEFEARERREHDDGLLALMRDLARRACDDPESLRQSVLDSLPKSREAGFASRYPPGSMQGCTLNAFERIRDGESAKTVVEHIYLGRGPVNVVATPAAPAVVAPVAKVPSEFAMLLPQFARFAEDSCRSPGSGTEPSFYYGGNTHHTFVGWYDTAYDIQIASLSGCPRRLFTDLVNLVLLQEWWKVRERGWLERQVSYYTPKYVPRAPRDPDNWSPPADPDHDEVWKRIGRLR